MERFFDRPLVLVAIALAVVLNFGAKKWVALMKIPEEKQQKAVLILKGGAMALAALIFLYTVMTQ